MTALGQAHGALLHDRTDGDRAAGWAIRHDLATTYLVEAGAGTGKTTALVGRILELVASGQARIDQVAAITFTEAAAAELRDRIGDALEQMAGGAPLALAVEGGPAAVGAGSAEERSVRRARAAEAVRQIDAAAIGTLHGFARRLLTEHPLEAGLPPVVEVLDETRSSMAFIERWRAFIPELLGDPAMKPALTASLRCGVDLRHWCEVARALNRDWDLVAAHPVLARPIPHPEGERVARPLTAALALAGYCSDPEDRLAAHLLGLRSFADRLDRARTETDVLALLAAAPPIAADRVGRQENWGGRIGAVRAALGEAADACRAEMDGVVRAALAHLLRALRAFTLRTAEARRREGRLEYHDLIVRARDLVVEHPEVRALLAERYRFLLVDEFQDTDPIQAELTVRLACDDPEAAGKHWTSLTVEPGRLFYVGDPKQSIYRFRRADISTFLRTRDTHTGRRLRLATNRRSVPGVVAWVNAVFGELMGEGQPAMQPPYEGLVAQRPAERPGPPVVLLGGSGAPRERIETVRRREAADVAAVLRRARIEGWPVGDEGRPATFADMTVLVPSRTGLPALQEALDGADVPYSLETTSLVYSSAEVLDLLAVLRALDDPADEISIVGALRSPLFGCGDDDLLAYRRHGGHWDYRRPAPCALGVDHPVVMGQAALGRLHERRRWLDVSGLVDAVLVDRQVFELALDEPRPREVWRRLRFVSDQARRFTDGVGGDLRRYLAWADLQRADDARVAEAVLPESDHDAVRVMTVHGAKGLEFPLVVVCGLHVVAPPRRRPRVLWGEHGPELVVNGSVRTEGFDALERREMEIERHERLRLLYVAATRARDHLVVSVHHKAGSDCLARSLADVCVRHPGLWRLQAGGEPTTSAPTRPGLGRAPAVGTDESPLARRRWEGERTAVLAAAATPRVLAATGLAKLADPDAPEGPDLGAEPWRRGRGGTAVGRAVHAVLQSLDLVTGVGLRELARASAATEGVPDRVAEIERLVSGALTSIPVRAAVAGGRYWREVYVGVPLGDRLLEGFVDLLVEAPDGLEVVDYKTDRVTGAAERAAAVAHYGLQGAAYAVAVERATGRPVSRCTLLFLGPSGATPCVLEDLDGLKARVVALVGEAGGSPAPPGDRSVPGRTEAPGSGSP